MRLLDLLGTDASDNDGAGGELVPYLVDGGSPGLRQSFRLEDLLGDCSTDARRCFVRDCSVALKQNTSVISHF